MDPISIHFHEIALKGKNRANFERRLQANLQAALGPLGRIKVVRHPGGLLIDGDADPAEVVARAREVCGVAYAMRVKRHPQDDLEGVARTIVEAIRREQPSSFRITSRRRDKSYDLTSERVNQVLGKMVKDATGVPVRLNGAALEAFVVVMDGQTLVGTEKIKAVGGLPVGTAGRVTALLSGGIDSPVAAWRMMKRGCSVDFVHFHSYPRVDRATIEKAEELVERLTRWQYRSKLFLVPLLEIQTAARLQAPEKLRVLLYRRFMVRIAQKIAERRRSRALVTGESVGQVASQTLQNIAAVDAVAKMPVLRPLCGMDKQEIVDQAKQLGTFEISIQPDQDCCQLFLPKHPAVASSDAECAEAEKAMDVDGLVARALAATERLTFRWPAESAAAAA
ncbi:MAG: tRNA 4-thiouridine(8) synthase ThiI [Myxococcaceae bacterium]|nr:tRNA 4-thiouridine(8) synthase ThiI [Myxococcaceae bacterium]